MGCWGSKNQEKIEKPAFEPMEAPSGSSGGNGIGQQVGKFQIPAPIDGHIRLPWAAEATKWRWLLRTSQSLVAVTLYGLASWLRFPSSPVWLQGLVATALNFPFMVAYHWLSMNNAGGYYDTFAEMYVNLPQHFQDIQRRGGHDYYEDIDQERRTGIVRTVNALESGIVFLAVVFSSLVLGCLCGAATGRSGTDFSGSFSWRFFEGTMFLVAHRIIGANIFEGKHYGLIQPEAMWQFECILADHMDSGNGVAVDCRMRPLRRHPHPSY